MPSSEILLPALAFSDESAIAAQGHTPEMGFRGQPLQPNLPGCVGARHAGPYHPELGFFVVHLHFQDFSRTYLAAQTMNHRACPAQVLDAGQLHKGQVMGIHTPNPHRQVRSDARTATTIQPCSFVLGGW